MFNWLVTIFMLVSLIILFAAWTRVIRVKEMVKGTEAEGQWSALRILVFVAMLAEVVLIILALVGALRVFAYLCPLYLIYFSVVMLYLVNFFLSAVESGGTRAEVAPPPPPPPPAAEPS